MSESKFVDELSKWAKAKSTNRQAKNLAVFLAVQDDVKKALASGYTLRTIWAFLKEQGKVSFTYETFRGLARKQILGVEDKTATTAADSTAKQPGFKFNPTPNKKDLI